MTTPALRATPPREGNNPPTPPFEKGGKERPLFQRERRGIAFNSPPLEGCPKGGVVVCAFVDAVRRLC